MPDMKKIPEKVMEVVKEQLAPDVEVKIESQLADDLGADSLDSVELIMAMEETFHIEISDEQAEKCKTVKDIVDLIGTLV